MSPKKLLIFGTHPQQFNGYSKVVYELTRRMAKTFADDYAVHVYGFQRFKAPAQHRADFGATGVTVYDAAAHEDAKGGQGFGIAEVTAFVKELRPDVCLVYNDLAVTTAVLAQLVKAKEEDAELAFKTVAYIDQVYGCQRKDFINYVNQHVDLAILFTTGWEETIKRDGLTVPTAILEHGLNKQMFYTVPRDVARGYFGISVDDFIIMNLNRNQPRKRWDTCIIAFAELVARYPDEPIKLLIATSPKGAWDLIDLYQRELVKRDVAIGDGMKRLVIADRPQTMSDFDVNVLYNVADIGINTCDGEGFGLCNFEQAAVGVPQVLPAVGGFKDIFDATFAELVAPRLSIYVDTTRDSVMGEAQLCDPSDFVGAVERYYFDRDRLAAHSKEAKERLADSDRFDWDAITAKLRGHLNGLFPVATSTVTDVTDVTSVTSVADATDVTSVADATTMTDEVLSENEQLRVELAEIRAKMAELAMRMESGFATEE